MPPSKRPSPPSAGDGRPGKKPKSNPSSPQDYSQAVRKKLAAASRTGQACDRCKERKMRCDPNPLGCEPCRQKNVACRTTDRITGRASERGRVEGLESELALCRAEVAAYRQRYGPIDVQTSNGYHNQSAGGYVADPTQSQQLSLLSNFTNSHTDIPGTMHAGPYLGPVKGTKVDMLNYEIDIADFPCADMDEPPLNAFQSEPILNKSYSSFLNTTMGVHGKFDKPELPEKADGLNWASWYIKVINPYVPILHEPTFMALINQFYDDPAFTPPAADNVMVYMVFAILRYQFGVRVQDRSQEVLEESNRYFHYALSFYPKLLADRTLANMRALGLICVHTRNFPKPGYSWLLSQQWLGMAIEMNLHRSTEKDPSPTKQMTALGKELAKRVFWSVLSINVMTGVKLGRPMPFSLEDIDVEFPEAVADNGITDESVNMQSTNKCDFEVGIGLFKLVPLLIELYTTVISVRKPPSLYVETVDRLEEKLTQLASEWRLEDMEESDGPTVFQLFLDSWVCEFRLTLHHPLLSTSQAQEVNDKNLDICQQSAHKLLKTVNYLYSKYTGLDFTWHSTVVYFLAIASMLLVYQKRKDRLSQQSLDELRREMDSWLYIISVADKVLGAGNRLVSSVKVLVEHHVSELNGFFQANSALQQNGYHQESHGQGSRQNSATYPSGDGYLAAYASAGNTQLENLERGSRASAYVEDPNLAAQTANQYTTGPYAYPEPSSASGLPYAADPNPYTSGAYHPSAEDQALVAAASSAQQIPHGLPYSATASSSNYPGTNAGAISPNQSWATWAAAQPAQEGDYQQASHSASALISLSRNDQINPAAAANSLAVSGGPGLDGGLDGVQTVGTWPFNMLGGQGGN